MSEVMFQRNIRGTVYEVEKRQLDACVAAFDITRDGIGQFKGDLGREAFLHLTARIAAKFVVWDAYDPFAEQRLLKVFRSVLAERRTLQEKRQRAQGIEVHGTLGDWE